MPYALRPDNKRKRPIRYQGESDDKLDQISEANCHVQAAQNFFSGHCSPQISCADSQWPILSYPKRTSPSRSLTIHPPSVHTVSAPAYPSSSTNKLSVAQHQRIMANIRFVRKRERRLHKHEHPKTHHHDAISIRPPLTRTTNRSPQHTPVSAPVYSIPKPAAFPSLSTDGLLPKDFLPGVSKHGLGPLMTALELRNQSLIEEHQNIFDCMYTNYIFPSNMHNRQRTWYADLKDHWVAGESKLEVTFISLWPSLRQTIIEQIRDDFIHGSYYESHYPVRCILGLTTSVLSHILDENSEAWDVDDDIPAHLRYHKRRHPHEIIDPDEPPQREKVRAIKFLKQNHLPGSLLGEWQYPLPSIEDFATWSKESVNADLQLDDHDHFRNLQSVGTNHPDVLSPEQTLAMLLLHGWKPPTSSIGLFPTNNYVSRTPQELQANVQAELHNQWQQSRQFADAEHRLHKRARTVGRSRTRAQGIDLFSTKETQRRSPRGLDPRCSGGKIAANGLIYREVSPSTISVLVSKDITNPKSSVNTVEAPQAKILDMSAGFDALVKKDDDRTIVPNHQRVERGCRLDIVVQPLFTQNAKRQCSQATANPSAMSSERGPYASIKTVYELQERNREHHGLRSQVPFIKREHREMNYLSSTATARLFCEKNFESSYLGTYDPIHVTLSAASYAQAATFDSKAALERVRVNEILKQHAQGVSTFVSYPSIPIIKEKEEDGLWRESIFDVLKCKAKRSYSVESSLQPGGADIATLSMRSSVPDSASTNTQRSKVTQHGPDNQCVAKARDAVRSGMKSSVSRPPPKMHGFNTINGFVPITRPITTRGTLLTTASSIQPPINDPIPQVRAQGQTLEFSSLQEGNDVSCQ